MAPCNPSNRRFCPYYLVMKGHRCSLNTEERRGGKVRRGEGKEEKVRRGAGEEKESRGDGEERRR